MNYRTIVADPPWHYEGFGSSPKSHKGNPTGDGIVRVTALPYASMTVDEIAALPVADWTHRDAALFLWTTNRYLPASFRVMRAWGFDYRQTLVWHKIGNPSPFGGSVAPIHAEFLLVGKRGQPKLGRISTSVIAANAPNRNQHSAKPEAFLDYIEEIGESPRLEMFARRARLGDWHYWGNESLDTAQIGEAA